MIQHDMMMFDHGMPGPDGTVSPEQRPEADVNIEFQSTAKMADGGAEAGVGLQGGEREVRDRLSGGGRPAHDQHRLGAVHGLVPAISLRENERGAQIGGGWDPHWHQPTDVFATFSDKDFRLGLNAAQTTLGAVAQLTGATRQESKRVARTRRERDDARQLATTRLLEFCSRRRHAAAAAAGCGKPAGHGGASGSSAQAPRARRPPR